MKIDEVVPRDELISLLPSLKSLLESFSLFSKNLLDSFLFFMQARSLVTFFVAKITFSVLVFARIVP